MLTAKNFWAFFGGLWLVVGLPFFVIGLYLGVQHVSTEQRLEAEGRTVEGMVLSKAIQTQTSSSSSTGSRRTSRSYEVTFRFPTDEDPVTGRADVSAEAWERLIEREPIAVTYLPDDPERHRVEGQTAGWILPVMFTALGGLFGGVGAFIVLRVLSRRRMIERLQRAGLTADATVTAVAPARIAINGVRQTVVRYRYRDQRGGEHFGSETLAPEAAAEWNAGDAARVRYDPRRPSDHVWLGRP
ncbi:MAG TPA: DUF3592 domain-containing protein [Gammaproteobacteria bacterium]